MEDYNKDRKINVKDFLYMNEQELEKKTGKKRFDVCLMNPPYLGETRNDYGIPLNFLHKVIEISDKIISIQPNTFLFKPYIKKSPDKNEKPLFDDFNKYYTYIEILDRTELDFAGTQLQELGIYTILKNKNPKIIVKNKYGIAEYNDATKISKYGGDELIKEFKNIIQPLYEKDSLVNHAIYIDKRHSLSVKKQEEHSNSNLYYVNVPAVRGNAADNKKLTMWTFCDKKTVPQQGTRPTGYFNFDDKDTAQNFINYLKCDFARICLWLLKNDFNLSYNMKYVPWFDFSDDHFNKSPREIDDWLFKKYEISDEIRKHVEEILPDYYNIR